MDHKSSINTSAIPDHIAIIMDGNGRWAKEHNKPRIFGHKHGVLSVRSVVEGAGEIGLKYLTLYAFSTENWNRPKVEIAALMQLLVATISNEVSALNKNNVRLLTIGDLSKLIIKLTGSKSKVSFENLPQDDPLKRKPDISKAKDVLNWEPSIDLVEGLNRTINYFK